MVNVIAVQVKSKKVSNHLIRRVADSCANVQPDNLNIGEPFVRVNSNLIIGLTYYNSAVKLTENGLLLGNVFEDSEDCWDKIGAFPDGSYGVFRWDNNYIEILSDIGATRTIWYYSDINYFIASTSQRMIISFLGSYHVNQDVIPWMMSTGTIGPFMSWDKRINCLSPNQKLLFDRQNNEIELQSEQFEYQIISDTKKKTKERLRNAIKTSFKQINIDVSNYYLTLSGGYDSRAILLNIENKEILHTITWGKKGNEDIQLTDASVAKQLSDYFKTNHEYLEIDDKEETSEVILDRFIKNGEGRIDHLAGYLDGFELWKNLNVNGVKGIIRGDEGFGWSEVNYPQNVIDSVGIPLLDDYDNIPTWIKDLYSDQKIPGYLKREDGESLAMWRDRLYHEFRIPIILSALTSLKTNYVEVSNPLLTKVIIREVRKQPDEFRTNKKLFKEIINQMSPKIPYAKHASTVNIKQYLRKKDIVEILKKELKNNKGNIIPVEITNYVLNNMKYGTINKTGSKNSNHIKEKIKHFIPSSMKNMLKKNIGKHMDFNVLAFRIYIILKMQEILNNDALYIK